MAAAVPSAVASTALAAAVHSERVSDPRIVSSAQVCPHQNRPIPRHTSTSRESLNANTTTTTIGAYRKR
jgi:hypothetical protein